MAKNVFSVTAKDLMRQDFLSVQEDSSGSKLAGKLVNSKYNNVVVLNKNKYVGMVSLKELLRKRIDFNKTKAKNLTEKAPVISRETEFMKIIELMHSGNARLLPVIEKEIIVGVVPVQRVIELIKEINGLNKIKSEQISSEEVVKINENDSLETAMRLMAEKNVKQLIVIKGFKISGIVTYKKIIEKLMRTKTRSKGKKTTTGHITDGATAFDAPVTNFMTTTIPLINAKTKVLEAVPVVRKHGLAIIAPNLRPKGIITSGNLLEAVMSLREETRKIQVVNLPKLDEIDYALVEKTISKFYDKIEKKVHQKPLLKIHFKESKKSGLRRMHSIHLKLSAAGINYSMIEEGWLLLSTLQSATKALGNKVNRSMREKY